MKSLAAVYFQWTVQTHILTRVNDTISRKRLSLSTILPSNPSDYSATLPLFSYFLRLPDQLVAQAHLRPEVIRKIRQTRDDQIRKLQRADETERAEDRASKRDKEKKEKRDQLLRAMNADESRKFLEKEKEKELRKNQKKMSKKA